MDHKIDIKTRELSEKEKNSVRFDLTVRGLLSLISAACVIVFAIMLSIHGLPIFAKGGLTGVCVGGIWIAVIAVDFGLVRSGIQLLAWRKARHIGVLPDSGKPSGGILEDVFNIFMAIIFVGLGIAVLIAGRLGLDGLQTSTQIPMSILSITFGLSSAASAAINIWKRRTGLADIVHEIPESSV